jgi:hypothetical protein
VFDWRGIPGFRSQRTLLRFTPGYMLPPLPRLLYYNEMPFSFNNAALVARVGAKQPGRRFEVTSRSLLSVRVPGLRFLRVFQLRNDGIAQAATDRLEVKLDIARDVIVQGSQQITAEGCTIWTAQPMSSPDFSQRMPALVATLHKSGQTLSQVVRIPQRHLKQAGSLDGKLFVEECE